MRKRIISMLLALVMVVGLMPGFAITASAASDGVTTVDELQTALNSGSTVKLGADIDLKNTTLTFPDDTPVTIDLNGHTLNRSSSGYVFTIEAADKVTITDSVGTGTVSKSGGWYFFYNEGYLKIDGGTYDKLNYDLVYTKGSSVTEITGCTFNGSAIIARQSDESTAKISGGNFTFSNNEISTGIWSSGITVTGGTFSKDPNPSNCFIDASQYTVTQNVDGTYTVGEKPATYTVTVTANPTTGGTVTGAGTYEEGKSITLTATANQGYQFKEWQVVSGGVTVADNKFTMPASNVEVKAVFEDDPTTYRVTIADNIEHGKVTADKSVAAEGELITLTVTPDENYEVSTYSITVDKVGISVSLSGNTFTMPACNVIVSVKFQDTRNYKVVLPANPGYTVARTDDTVSPVPPGGTYAFTVRVWDGYEKTENFKVYDWTNDKRELTPDINGIYTIRNVDKDLRIVVSGVLPCKPDSAEDFSGSNYPFAFVCKDHEAHTITAPYYSSDYITIGDITGSTGAGCYLDVTFRVKEYFDGNITGHVADNLPETATFVAKWNVSNKKWEYIKAATEYAVSCAYTINYALNGGDASNPDTYTIETETFTLTNPTRTGYTFKGWSGTGLEGDTNLTVTVAKGSTGDRTYTANWTANTYTVKFDANGGIGTMSDQSVTYDVAQNLNANAFTKTNMHFNGWKDENGASYTAGQNVKNLTTENGGIVTLYAQWSDKPAQIINFDTTNRTATYGDGVLDARTATAKGAITYSSSNPEVVTVDTNGVVTVLNAGETTITASAAETDACAAGFVSYTLTVAPKTITITPADVSMYRGREVPKFTEYTVNGLLEGDTLTTEPTLSTEADGSTVGEFAITASGADAGANYTIRYVDGVLTVSKKPSKSEPTYTPTIDKTGDGKVTVSDKTPEKGDKVTITVKPDKGYVVDEVTVTDKKGDEIRVRDNGDGTYTFTQPAGKVKIEVIFAEIPEIELPFTDISEDDDIYEAVAFLYGNGLMVGVGDGTTFAPGMGLSRAMLAQILHVYEGEPAALASNFTDVARGFWYTDAIDWATHAGIIAGYGNGMFGPNDTLTREQLAVMLYQYALSRGWDVKLGAALTQPDAHTVNYWAVDAVTWAVNNGLLTGNGVGCLAAGDPATRADVAEAFMALVQLYA